MKLAIASPSASAYSETFIKMQMERLPCRLQIHGGPVATETVPGGLIQPLHSFRGVLDTAYWRGLRGTKWEGPQSAELKRRLNKYKVEVVLANYGTSGAVLLPICRALSIPLVVHFHGFDAHMTHVVEENRDSYKRLGRHCAAIVVVSERMQDALEEIGIPREKVVLLRYGVDIVRFKEKSAYSEAPVFFGVGRFVDKKAPYLTVLAFKKVHDRLPQSRLILAGDGALLEATRNVAQALGLGAAVEFPSVLTPEQVATHMQEATAFVQHSIVPNHGPSAGDSEGTPVAVLEAMASGLPVVSTRHAGIGEVIEHRRTGILVEERDTDAMAEGMIEVAESSVFAKSLGSAARKEVLEKFTADHYISSLERVLKSVVRHA